MTKPPESGDDELARFIGEVKAVLEPRLARWLDARVAVAEGRGAAVGAVADGVRDLALRGGKRLRAVLLAAAYLACGGKGGIESVAAACVALELFQAYLLVHDDWMDGDATRRGGPSVPALMRGMFDAERADAASILAGDLLSAWSKAALLEVDLPFERAAAAAGELARAEEAVVEGQILDVEGAARDLGQVERVHALKSASYSTTGPVAMGARLAGASEAQVAALRAYAEPLGVAFQLRDDVLGTFGDEATMGKPAGSDLRAGKRTAVVVEALGDGAAREAVASVLGRIDATDAEVRAAVEAIEACGARARVEARIAALVTASRAALGETQFLTAGRVVLEAAIAALTERKA
jgi:geranylgeranyl diphosphate synthase type I